MRPGDPQIRSGLTGEEQNPCLCRELDCDFSAVQYVMTELSPFPYRSTAHVMRHTTDTI